MPSAAVVVVATSVSCDAEAAVLGRYSATLPLTAVGSPSSGGPPPWTTRRPVAMTGPDATTPSVTPNMNVLGVPSVGPSGVFG